MTVSELIRLIRGEVLKDPRVAEQEVCFLVPILGRTQDMRGSNWRDLSRITAQAGYLLIELGRLP